MDAGVPEGETLALKVDDCVGDDEEVVGKASMADNTKCQEWNVMTLSLEHRQLRVGYWSWKSPGYRSGVQVC